MKRLEVSGAVRPIYESLGVKRLIYTLPYLNDIHVLVVLNNSHNKTNKSTNVKIIFFYTQFVIRKVIIEVS